MKGKKPLYETQKASTGLIDKLLMLDRATFTRMVMRANLPAADSRELLRAFDEAKE